MFELLSAKRVFKTWLIAKMFKGWLHNTRRNHYARIQQSLASQSFLAKPMFCKAVLQLRNITHDMTKVQLLDIQPGKAYHLEVSQLSTCPHEILDAVLVGVSTSHAMLLKVTCSTSRLVMIYCNGTQCACITNAHALALQPGLHICMTSSGEKGSKGQHQCAGLE